MVNLARAPATAGERRDVTRGDQQRVQSLGALNSGRKGRADAELLRR